MDATTILAVICCAVVFAGWVVLPHTRTSRQKVQRPEPAREPVAAA